MGEELERVRAAAPSQPWAPSQKGMRKEKGGGGKEEKGGGRKRGREVEGGGKRRGTEIETKYLPCRPDDPCSIPRSYTDRRELTPQTCPLITHPCCDTHVHKHAHTTHTHTHIINNNEIKELL